MYKKYLILHLIANDANQLYVYIFLLKTLYN